MAHAFKVAPGAKIRLSDYDANADGGLSKEDGQAKLAKLTAELGQIQEELYAAGQHSVLIILQGIDTSGKDGTIRHVMSGVNPQGCQVYSFKAPSAEEQDHDYLWRCQKALPERGRRPRRVGGSPACVPIRCSVACVRGFCGVTRRYPVRVVGMAPDSDTWDWIPAGHPRCSARWADGLRPRSARNRREKYSGSAKPTLRAVSVTGSGVSSSSRAASSIRCAST